MFRRYSTATDDSSKGSYIRLDQNDKKYKLSEILRRISMFRLIFWPHGAVRAYRKSPIGGGVAGTCEFFMPALLKEMRGQLKILSGDTLNRVQIKVYDLDDPDEFEAFAQGDSRELKIYGSGTTVTCDPQKRIGIATSKIGASRDIALGAYAYALNKIDNR